MVELYNKNLYTYKFIPMCNDNGLTYLKNYIDDIITDKVRALTMRMNVFELSFTPKGKNLIYTSTNT